MSLDKLIKASNKLIKASSILALAATTISTAYTQDSFADNSKGFIGEIDPELRAVVLGSTVSLNGLICGINAAVKKRDVLKDTAQCLGAGVLQYIGMETAMYDVPVLPGISLRLVETGSSIMENTIAGREPFELLNYSLIGPGMIQIDTKDPGVDFFWRIAPTFGIIFNLAKGHEIDWLNTFSYQTPVFMAEADRFNEFTTGITNGYAIGNVLTYDPRFKHALPHEFNHVLQYARYQPAQAFMPEQIDFLEQKMHLRIGEDLALISLNAPHLICSATGEPACARRFWNPTEVEAYTMETGRDTYFYLPYGKIIGDVFGKSTESMRTKEFTKIMNPDSFLNNDNRQQSLNINLNQDYFAGLLGRKVENKGIPFQLKLIF